MTVHQDRTALVTGAARRIGAYLAESLAQAGYALHLHTGHDTQAITALAIRLREIYGIQVTPHVLDFTDSAGLRSWVRTLLSDERAPQLVVHAASHFPPPAEAGPPEALTTGFAVHVQAADALCEALDTSAGDAHLVNVLDARLDLLDSTRLGYELTKHTLARHTLLAAKRLAPLVRVNAISPGLVLPPRGRDAAHLRRLAEERAVLGTPANLADVSRALRFLEQVRSVTGQVIYVDAGEHLGPPLIGNRCPPAVADSHSRNKPDE
jgi:NAD(P)-dependent dehydrogenase (short-subunit alcohol dehydrogenase family)